MATELNKQGDAHAESLIDAGKVDRDSAWSMSAADENALLCKDGADWDNYSNFHLGIKPDEAERTKAHYAYPHGKGGKVYRRALIAAESRATAQGDDAIAAAAKRLLARLDDKNPADDASGADAAAAAQRRRAGFAAFPRIAERVFNTPLLIAQPKLAAIVGVLGSRFGVMEDDEAGGGKTLEDIEAEARAQKRRAAGKLVGMFDDDDPDGDGDDDLGYLITDDGMAVVPVDGTLVYKSSWLGALSGMVAYSDIGAMVADATASPAVKGLLLLVDSSGGEVSGCFDLSDQIMAARGAKPIFAVAADRAYSGAYALAAAADKVFVSRTAGVGSIGVVGAHYDWSAANAMDGLKVTYIYSGARKVDGNSDEPLSDQAKETWQAECDQLRDLFVSCVARYRGLSADDLRATEAACYLGDNALAAHLADAIGTPIDALAALRGEVARRAAPQTTGAVAPQPQGGTSVDAPARPLAAESNVVDLAAIRSEAKADAVRDHVEIVELCKLANKPALAADFIQRGLKSDAVRQALQQKKAAESEAHTITGHADAGSGLSDQVQTNSLWDRVLARQGLVKKQ